jgi:hypothetical protein
VDCVVHQYAAHRLRCDGEELCPILPLDVSERAQLQVGFMDQISRLQRVVTALRAKLALGQSLEFVIYDR